MGENLVRIRVKKCLDGLEVVKDGAAIKEGAAGDVCERVFKENERNPLVWQK